MRRATNPLSQSGVTLVEMIVAIVVGGVLISLVGMFGRWQILSYFDVSSRAALADAADTALRRIARDLQGALPNSVRVTTNRRYLEFIPIKDAGRYRAETAGGTDFPLDFGASATATQFDVLGPTVNIENGNPPDEIVIYNLGISGADAYASPSENRVQPTAAGTGLSRIAIPPAFHFPFASPTNRFHVVGNPVSLECDPVNGVIRRYWNYGFLGAQPVAFGEPSALLVANVDTGLDAEGRPGCFFTYLPGALQRNGLVFIYLRLRDRDSGETVSLMHQVEVLNTP